jgi:hypothetical protein
MKVSLLIFFLSASVLACTEHSLSGSESSNVNLWERPATVHLPYQNATFGVADDTGVKFNKVASDSRCPENANCIWEGEVTVEFLIIKNKQTMFTYSISSLHPVQEFEVNGRTFVFTLVEVIPYPKLSKHEPEQAYQVELKIEPK